MHSNRQELIREQEMNNRLAYRLQVIAGLIVIAIIMALMGVISG